MWILSCPTVQWREQWMVWSSYFWLGALMSSVTAPPGPPESMTPEEPEFRRAERSGPPQIILDLEAAVVMVGGGGGGVKVPPSTTWTPSGGRGQRFPLCSPEKTRGVPPSVCYSRDSSSSMSSPHFATAPPAGDLSIALRQL